MEDNLIENSDLALVKKNELLKAGSSLGIINKIIYNGADKLFNEAFYLLNSMHLEKNDENYCFNIEHIFSYLKKKNFKFIVKSKDDRERAIDLFSKAISIKPLFKLAYCYRGVALGNVFPFSTHEDYEKAMDNLKVAIEIDPNYAEAYFYRGFFLYKTSGSDKGISNCVKLFKAIFEYDQAIEIDPQFAKAYYFRALAKKEYIVRMAIENSEPSDVQNYDEVLADLTRCLEVDPHYSNAYHIRGKMRGRDYHSAIADFTKAIEIAPKEGRHYIMRGKIKYKLKDLTGAISDFSMAINLEDFSKAIDLKIDTYNSALCYNDRGTAKRELGDLEGAVADYKKAILVNSRFPDAHQNLAEIIGKPNN